VTGRWWDSAACRGDPIALWTPSYREATTPPELAARCSQCPVILPCVSEAIEDDDRCIRGGTSRPQRLAMRRGATVVVADLHLRYNVEAGAVVVVDPDAVPTSTALDLPVLRRLTLLRLAPAAETVDAEAFRLRQAGSTWREVAQALRLGRESTARTAAGRHSARVGASVGYVPAPRPSTAIDHPWHVRFDMILDAFTAPAPAPASMTAENAVGVLLAFPRPRRPSNTSSAGRTAQGGLSVASSLDNLAASGAPGP